MNFPLRWPRTNTKASFPDTLSGHMVGVFPNLLLSLCSTTPIPPRTQVWPEPPSLRPISSNVRPSRNCQQLVGLVFSGQRLTWGLLRLLERVCRTRTREVRILPSTCSERTRCRRVGDVRERHYLSCVAESVARGLCCAARVRELLHLCILSLSPLKKAPPKVN